MLPEIKLQGDVDAAALSPLLRGMLLSVAYADGEGGIGLTATGAMNRKFVHWAAVNFLWPVVKTNSEKNGYTPRGRKPGRKTDVMSDPAVIARREKALMRQPAAE